MEITTVFSFNLCLFIHVMHRLKMRDPELMYGCELMMEDRYRLASAEGAAMHGRLQEGRSIVSENSSPLPTNIIPQRNKEREPSQPFFFRQKVASLVPCCMRRLDTSSKARVPDGTPHTLPTIRFLSQNITPGDFHAPQSFVSQKDSAQN
jgi:hypothetical protein